MSAPAWSAVVPIVPVTDVARAQAWYRDVLGCEVAWTWQDGFGCVSDGHLLRFGHGERTIDQIPQFR